MLYTGGPAVTQDIGPAQAGTYSLSVTVCNRADGTGSGATYTISLLDGTTALCSEVGLNSSSLAGQFETLTQSCPDAAPAGHLIVSLGCSGPQCNFGSVAVTFTPAVPPQIESLTFKTGLVSCTKCDGTDYGALPSGSMYQGASFSLAIPASAGVNSPVCSATLNATASATCMGGVNVAPADITFIITVTSPAGTPMFPPFAFLVPSFILEGAPTGNVTIVLGFDAATSVPRAAQVYTQ